MLAIDPVAEVEGAVTMVEGVVADVEGAVGIVETASTSIITQINQYMKAVVDTFRNIANMAAHTYTQLTQKLAEMLQQLKDFYMKFFYTITITAVFGVIPAWIGLFIFIAGIFCPFLTVNHVPPIGISFLPGIIFYIYIFFYKLIFDWLGYQIMKKATGDTSLGDSIFEIFKTIDIGIYKSGLGLHEWFCFTKLPDAVVDRYFTFDIGSLMPCIRLSILNDILPIGPTLPDILCVEYKVRYKQWQYPHDEGKDDYSL